MPSRAAYAAARISWEEEEEEEEDVVDDDDADADDSTPTSSSHIARTTQDDEIDDDVASRTNARCASIRITAFVDRRCRMTEDNKSGFNIVVLPLTSTSFVVFAIASIETSNGIVLSGWERNLSTTRGDVRASKVPHLDADRKNGPAVFRSGGETTFVGENVLSTKISTRRAMIVVVISSCGEVDDDGGGTSTDANDRAGYMTPIPPLVAMSTNFSSNGDVDGIDDDSDDPHRSIDATLPDNDSTRHNERHNARRLSSPASDC